jgi:DNA-binding transcriptional LysR family regulator
MEDQALAELANVAAGQTGRLRVAYLLHGDVVLQGKVVAEFRRCYPHVQLGTSAGHSRTNVELLRNGEADVAFIELPTDIPDGIAVQSIGHCHQLMLVLPLGHELANSESVPVNALREMPLVLAPASENPAMTAAFKGWLIRLTGKGPNVLAEEPVDQAIQFIATSSTAAAVVNSWRASIGAPGVIFKPLTPAPLVEFSVAYRSNDPLRVLKNLLAVVHEIRVSTQDDMDVTGELL